MLKQLRLANDGDDSTSVLMSCWQAASQSTILASHTFGMQFLLAAGNLTCNTPAAGLSFRLVISSFTWTATTSPGWNAGTSNAATAIWQCPPQQDCRSD